VQEFRVAVIGAGVVGLAASAVLAETVGEVLVIERHDGFGREASSRTGGVIHSGIFFEMSSMKSTLCIEGAPMLYKYCEGNSIPHARRGKYIVATEEGDLPRLEELFKRGERMGLRELEYLDGRQVNLAEPAVSCYAAVLSLSSGTVDPDALMKSFYDEASSRGVTFAFGREVEAIERTRDGFVISMYGEKDKALARAVVNSAGLGAAGVASLAGIDVAAAGYELSYLKGTWFSYGKEPPLRRLVFPLGPECQGPAGVPATFDASGRLRFGPDCEEVEDPFDLSADPLKGDAYHDAVVKYLPGIERGDIYPETAGVRPGLKGEGFGDFIIKEESDRGLPGLINLIGIDTPGLTCCLSIAGRVNGLVQEALG
jgi:L-2-hydroxyglutarate oxidase LhgO